MHYTVRTYPQDTLEELVEKSQKHCEVTDAVVCSVT